MAGQDEQSFPPAPEVYASLYHMTHRWEVVVVVILLVGFPEAASWSLSTNTGLGDPQLLLCF